MVPLTKIGNFRIRVGLERKMMSFALDTLSLEDLYDTHLETVNQHLVMTDGSSGKRLGLVI